jgi:hypothetical protein
MRALLVPQQKEDRKKKTGKKENLEEKIQKRSRREDSRRRGKEKEGKTKERRKNEKKKVTENLKRKWEISIYMSLMEVSARIRSEDCVSMVESDCETAFCDQIQRVSH